MSSRSKFPEKVRRQIEEFFESGNMDPKDVASKLSELGVKFGSSNPIQVVAGMMTLWKRRMAGTVGFEGKAGHEPKAAPPPQQNGGGGQQEPQRPPIEFTASPSQQGAPSDGFSFGASDNSAHGSPEGFAFGQRNVEYHVRRVGPNNDGFLGAEPDGFDMKKLGEKYGSGTYHITKYVNGVKIGPITEHIAGSYGRPRFPQNQSSAFPRLRPIGEPFEDDARAPERRPSPSGSDVSETVRAFKDLSELTKPAGAAERVIEKAVEAFTNPKPQTNQESVVSVIQAQIAKIETEQKVALAKAEDERKAVRAEAEARALEKEAEHKRDMERLKAEYEFREKESVRVAAEREKRDSDQRAFMALLDNDREQRTNKAIEETQGLVVSMQQSLQDELKKDREHQAALGKLKDDATSAEREKNNQLFALQKNSSWASSRTRSSKSTRRQRRSWRSRNSRSSSRSSGPTRPSSSPPPSWRTGASTSRNS